MQVLSLMRLAPADEDDRLAKAALYTKYAELLPAALSAGSPHLLQLISELLSGIKIVIAANPVPHQNLFRSFPGAVCQSICSWYQRSCK